MKYTAKPVIVDAWIIIGVGPVDYKGSIKCALQNGECRAADKGMTARYIPTEGDYWVRQSDGYEYINPKDVFERKYEPVVGQ